MKNKDKYCTVRGYELQRREENLLTHSMEDYLEMIYRQCLDEGFARTNTLAEQLNVQAPSVSKMVQKLTRLGLLNYEKYGVIRLTEKGKSIGAFLLYRHNTIKDFLRLLTIDEHLLSQTETLEHNINIDTLKKLTLLIDFFKENADLQEKFQTHVKNNI
ncbi:iron dependent repressor, metal binding and dimerization domain protein [Serpentinicella sp. ANB-PHB4]|uniref:metal-dependent transcriptional regulator n=1 Tax=Serpentinicella sp. ANB-PHB4 TaxID=3074076 RepID=UPI002863D406|nr:iron dependent repressor, metal binding and dimerization domain protein [Serpentinicella sp. ANB-PHB4]MDR5659888.1 iron dependent repressor, metal binding and dimerization domain protein [Serpentinicella sp. ANB-PHB4]